MIQLAQMFGQRVFARMLVEPCLAHRFLVGDADEAGPDVKTDFPSAPPLGVVWHHAPSILSATLAYVIARTPRISFGVPLKCRPRGLPRCQPPRDLLSILKLSRTMAGGRDLGGTAPDILVTQFEKRLGQVRPHDTKFAIRHSAFDQARQQTADTLQGLVDEAIGYAKEDGETSWDLLAAR